MFQITLPSKPAKTLVVTSCKLILVSFFLIGCGGSEPENPKVVDTPEPIIVAPEPEPEPDPESNSATKPAPQGIFHSAGVIKSTSERASLVRGAVEGQDYVSGTLVRVSWKAVNPSEGVFDFSSIEKELTQAAIYDTGINLAVVDSKETPEFVLKQCETFSYVFQATDTFETCLPWDTSYQNFKRELIFKLGEQFDNHPSLSSVYFTYAAMTNGVEMHWRVNEDEYREAGYTADKLSQAYNDVMDMYAEAFETTSVIMEVHSVFNESYLADNAFDYCYDVLGSRCGVAIWWCASRMATDPKEAEYKVFHIAQQATKLTFAVCQTIGSFTSSPERFNDVLGWTSEEALRYEMEFFLEEGFNTFELWSNDLINPSLVEIITEIYPQQ
ncbi:MAG: hypothetical protein ABJH06_17525 [Paraglaciecola sp.]|uniref:hypothetical protein n=1 Tax=Paraglaciecola sp. TaxID=1920173 RepID=UPI0032979E6A